jgi:hypothetical protein
VVLLGTMVATNFSAFTVFGASGAGYRDGYAFFPIMGFGTGFMAITFWIIGRRIWHCLQCALHPAGGLEHHATALHRDFQSGRAQTIMSGPARW